MRFEELKPATRHILKIAYFHMHGATGQPGRNGKRHVRERYSSSSSPSYSLDFNLCPALAMSLATLVNGAGCGPVNPLQSLTKNLENDRGLQQVHVAWMCIRTVCNVNMAFRRIILELAGLTALEAYVCVLSPLSIIKNAHIIYRRSALHKQRRTLGRMLRTSSLQVKAHLRFPL